MITIYIINNLNLFVKLFSNNEIFNNRLYILYIPFIFQKKHYICSNFTIKEKYSINIYMPSKIPIENSTKGDDYMQKYFPKGVCSREIIFDVDGGKIKDVEFVGGCEGNLKGISHLVEGMDIDEVIDKLSGIRCGFKNTSCPDQFSKALKEYKEKANS